MVISSESNWNNFMKNIYKLAAMSYKIHDNELGIIQKTFGIAHSHFIKNTC